MKLYNNTQIDSDEFLITKNWQDCFNSLSDLELKIASIFTILGCPNNTCRRAQFYIKVLHYLGVRTSQNPKLEFQKSIDKTISKLVSSNIFKEYNINKEHPRIKIDKTKMDLLDSYLRKYYKNELSRGNKANELVQINSRSKGDNLGLSVFGQLGIEEDEIPNLDDYFEDGFGSDVTFQNEPSNDDDLLGGFLDEDLPEIAEEMQDRPESNSKRNFNIKESILRNFSLFPKLTIEENYSDIKISLNDYLETFLIIEIDQPSNLLNCFVVIEYLRESTKSILKALSKNYTNITLCIDEIDEEEVFLLKQRIDLTRYNELEVLSIIESLLKTTLVVTTIIEKHL